MLLMIVIGALCAAIVVDVVVIAGLAISRRPRYRRSHVAADTLARI